LLAQQVVLLLDLLLKLFDPAVEEFLSRACLLLHLELLFLGLVDLVLHLYLLSKSLLDRFICSSKCALDVIALFAELPRLVLGLGRFSCRLVKLVFILALYLGHLALLGALILLLLIELCLQVLHLSH